MKNISRLGGFTWIALCMGWAGLGCTSSSSSRDAAGADSSVDRARDTAADASNPDVVATPDAAIDQTADTMVDAATPDTGIDTAIDVAPDVAIDSAVPDSEPDSSPDVCTTAGGCVPGACTGHNAAAATMPAGPDGGTPAP